jgi:alkylated DNA repair dioxygenase AlkB
MAVCDIEGAIKYIENLYTAVPSTAEEKSTKEILGSLVQRVNATRATVRDAASFVANAGPIDIGIDLTPYLSTLEDTEQPSPTGMVAGMVLGETKSMEVSEFLDLLSEISADVDRFKGLDVPYVANVALSTYAQVIRKFVAAKGASPINVKLVTQVIHGASNTEHLAIFRKDTNTLEIAMHPSGNVDASSLLLPTAKAALSAIVVVLTEQGLADNPNLNSMVTALRTKVMRLQEGKKGAPSMAKGLSSNQHFIAETLTSFRFQKLLASLTGEKNTVKTKLVRIFKKLINSVKIKMNIAVGTPTLLEEALALVELSISTTKEEEAYIRGMDIPLEEYSIVPVPEPVSPSLIGTSYIPGTGKDNKLLFSRIKGIVDAGVQKAKRNGHKAVWFGDVVYEYTGSKHLAQSMPTEVAEIARDAEKKLGLPEGTLNSVLINSYPTGAGIPAHSDSERIFRLKDNSVGSVVTVNLGGTSEITIQDKKGKVLETIEAKDGDIYAMPAGKFQDTYLHKVGSASAPRISLTFRTTAYVAPVATSDPVPETPPWEVDSTEGSDSYMFKSTLVGRSLGEYKDGTLNTLLNKLKTKFFALGKSGDRSSVEFSNIRDDIKAIVTHLSNAKSARESQKETTQSGFVPGKGYLVSGSMYTNPGQTAAIDAIKSWYTTASRAFMLQGAGGTGKTTVISVLIKELGLSSKEVAFAAPTNKAKKQIKKANTGTPYEKNAYYTIAQLLGIKETDGVFKEDKYANPPELPKVLVVDEVSMLKSEDYRALMLKIQRRGTKVIFMGDHAQLAPVNDEHASIKSVAFDETEHSAVLTELMRQVKDSPIINFTQRLRKIVNRVESWLTDGVSPQKVKNDLAAVVTEGGNYHRFDYEKNEGVIVTDEAFLGILPSFIEDYLMNPAGTKFIHYKKHNDTAGTSAERTALIRKALYKNAETEAYIEGEPLVLNGVYLEDAMADNDGWLDNAEEFTVVSSEILTEHVRYKVGDKVKTSLKAIEMHIVTATDDIDGVTRIFRIPVGGEAALPAMLQSEAEAYPKGSRSMHMLTKALAFGISHSYVINTHKSQGSTYDNVYMDLGNITGLGGVSANDSAKAAYVAASRPRKKLVIMDTREGAVTDPGPLRSPEHVAPAFKGVDKAESSDIIDKHNKCNGKG